MNDDPQLMTTGALVTAACLPAASRIQRHAAFAQLVDQHQDVAFRYAFRILGDRHLAQDATQEAFITAYQQLAQLREPAAFPGWLRRIVQTQCNRLTRGKRLPTTPLDNSQHAPSPDADPANLLLEQDMKVHILTAIAALPEHEQVVVRLFYFDGYSIKDVAAALKLPVTTIKKRLQYARTRLRGQLVDAYETGVAEGQNRAVAIVEYLLPAPVNALCPLPVSVAHNRYRRVHMMTKYWEAARR